MSGNNDGKNTLKKSATKNDGYATNIPLIVFDSPRIIPQSVIKQTIVNNIKSQEGVNVKKSMCV